MAGTVREPLPVPPRWFPPAALGAGVVTAALVVDYLPGIGLTLALAVIGGTLLAAVRGSMDAMRWWFVAVGAGLAVMPALRDAEWLVALDLLAVAALGCLTLTGVGAWRSVVVAAVSVPLRALLAPLFLARPYAGTRADRWAGPLRAAGLTAVLVVVFGALFASADRAFGEVVDAVVPDMTVDVVVARIVVTVVVTALVAGGLLAHLRPVALPEPLRRERVASAAEWVVPLGALVALFAVFVGVQAAVLFGGHEHVLRTSGLTYAEYARQGFFQLLVVVALTFAVVAAVVRIAPPTRLRRVLLGALCALTAVVLASALRRLGLYEQAFGLSRLRVLAYAIAIWLGVVLVLVVLAGVWGRVARTLPALVLGSAATVLLALNVADADAIVARSLVDRWERTGKIDTYYVSTLSADAAPALATLPAPIRDCVLAPHDDPAGWPEWNLARSRAADLVTGVQPAWTCRYVVD